MLDANMDDMAVKLRTELEEIDGRLYRLRGTLASCQNCIELAFMSVDQQAVTDYMMSANRIELQIESLEARKSSLLVKQKLLEL